MNRKEQNAVLGTARKTERKDNYIYIKIDRYTQIYTYFHGYIKDLTCLLLLITVGMLHWLTCHFKYAGIIKHLHLAFK